MQYNLKNEQIEAFNDSMKQSFPKYTSQLVNLANQNAQGTRPCVVGQMSDLFQEFAASGAEKTIEAWRSWYCERYPDALDRAADKIWEQVLRLREAMTLIDHNMVRRWTEDLVINKTFNGLYLQRAILASLSQRRGQTFQLATPEEEAKGIDGYIGGVAYSIKPETYRTMNRLPEMIDVKMIYYAKVKTGLKIEVEE